MITSLYYFCLKQGEKLVTVSIIHRRKIKIIKDFYPYTFLQIDGQERKKREIKIGVPITKKDARDIGGDTSSSSYDNDFSLGGDVDGVDVAG